jgi:hypothetical protein
MAARDTGSRGTNARDLAHSFQSAVRNGLPVIGLLCLIDAAVVAVYAIATPVQQTYSIASLPATFIGNQIAIHVVVGFIMGAATLSLSKALIGAALGPLIDIDHVGSLLSLPVDPRAGHSLVVIALLILLVWGLSLWSWGGRDFALFASMQFAAHFWVAPPGFPLLSPFSVGVYSFPYWVYMPVALGLAAVLLAKSLRGRGGREAGPGKDQEGPPL